MIAMTNPFKTTQQVAKQLGLTDGRIRQICIEHNIGQLLGGTRVFTSAEIKQIEKIRGANKKSQKSP